jgi:polysaccharide deacetylase family protein (PEP-CTERM system associated)
MPPSAGPRRHILTVALEDYFQVSPFRDLIAPAQWSRFERRLEIGTTRTLDLLDEFGIRATFFVLGWVADVVPELVRRVSDRGHEVASRGYYHRGVREMGSEFRDDLARARESLERASGQRVIGYRMAERWLAPSDLHALDILADEGYAYDSSIKPAWRAYAHEPWRRFLHRHGTGSGGIWEVPLSSMNLLGFDVPVAGGNHFRQFPHRLVKRAVARWDRTCSAPFVMYFHTWELDPEQPRISTTSALAHVRQYRNLDRMEGILRDYFRTYAFEGVADHLGIAAGATVAGPVTDSAAWDTSLPPALVRSAAMVEVAPVTVVVPCFNEAQALPYLANTLTLMEHELADRYALRFIFVDDGSEDRTSEALDRLFGSRSNCTLLRHERNRGISAAILTGLRGATTEIVCSIDCDCTYDPHQLGNMIPLLADGVDLVTASPYHPLGSVKNVQGWRLLLSQSASGLYRLVLRQKLHTYTSCFRVYRRSAVLGLDLQDPGYLGIVELVGKLDLDGRTVIEYPTRLEARLLGRSKMKVVRNVVRHLGQLARFAALRLLRARPAPPTPAEDGFSNPSACHSGTTAVVVEARPPRRLRHTSSRTPLL